MQRINFFTIAVAIFWFTYTLFLIYGLVQASNLVPVQGELISARASYRPTSGGRSSPSWNLDVTYTYRFNNVSYDGNHYRIGGDDMVLESIAAGKAAEMMAANKNVTVWVNPNRPKFAVLERTIGLLAWLFWAFLIVLVWVIYHFSPRIKTINPVLWESKSSKKTKQSPNVLEVADSYIAYGRTAQAISVLENALRVSPHRKDIADKLSKLKQLS
jgi:preprotein translocase subunit SecG